MSGPSPCHLALDCTLPGLTLALQVAEKSFFHTDATPRAADALHPALQTLCSQAGIVLADVQTIAVTTGPGSFTGIRLGLAVAQALKLVNPALTIIGLPTLALLARQYLAENPTPALPFTVLLDAAGGMVYRQDFSPTATPLSPAAVQSQTELTLPHPVYLPTGLLLPVGPPVARFFTTLQPAMLLAGLADATLHVAPEPTYLKPLGYRLAAS